MGKRMTTEKKNKIKRYSFVDLFVDQPKMNRGGYTHISPKRKIDYLLVG